MGSRLKIACASIVFLVGGLWAVHAQQNPFRLKDPDQKKLCVACHSDFEATLKKKFVHSPVKAGECASCHDPHASAHDKLLSTDAKQVCTTCHDSVVPAKAKSTHKVVADGECQKCHDPHASDNPANLKAAGSQLCFGCHKDLGAAVAKAKFKHAPVEQGCLTCHGAHASEQAPSLLKSTVPGLCVSCHKADTPAFLERHRKYPVGKADCTSCHDPHGSSQSALLLENVHPPLANRACAQCHEPPDSATPFATKRVGYDLCKGCHNEMVVAALGKPRLHWAVADKRSCLHCHNPHASTQPKLLVADNARLCGSCHADTVKRMTAITVKHKPVQDGNCTACHSPHAATGVYLVDQPSIIATCTACHDYSAHSAHPIGEKALDPRNKNLQVDCLSCHKGHGTDHKYMLLSATNLELCTQCHKQYAR
jgi:predicted CXXCH cytochrome family protein